MITKETIDKVFEYARVEEVISDFIALKKTGANFKGLSPFTNEKTPSFIVSPSKQIWKDFSSGKGGNVIAFLMEHEQFNYPESIRYLANKYNIEIIETNDKSENIEERNTRESLFIINSFAQEYFQNIFSIQDLELIFTNFDSLDDKIQTQDIKMDQREIAKLKGFEGDACNECGSFTLVRNGTCLKCNNCGSTTGCS